LLVRAVVEVADQHVASVQQTLAVLDNDGSVDIVYNDLSGQVFGLLKNEDGKSFRDITWSSKFGNLSRNLSGWSIGFVDFDNDGWKDIYSANGDDKKAGEAKAKAVTIAGTIATKYPQSDYAARAATLVYQLQESIPIYGTDRQ